MDERKYSIAPSALERIDDVVLDYLEGKTIPEGGGLIYKRTGQRGGLVRVQINANDSVIVKLWPVESKKERVKSFIRISNGIREWKIMNYIRQIDLQVPEPLYFYHRKALESHSFEVMVLTDLGTTVSGVPFIKDLIKKGDEETICCFEDFIIETTRKLIDGRVIDIDNQLNNYLVDSSGIYWRIDFECARKRSFPIIYYNEYVMMLERLFRSYHHAVHPDERRTVNFMEKVAVELAITSFSKNKISSLLQHELKLERIESGLPYSISIDW